MNGAESLKFVGRQGRLHGAGVPWGVPVVVIDTRRSYGRDQFLVMEPKQKDGEPIGKVVWVEADRVEMV